MAQTLVSLLVHVILSTRNRQSLITPEVEPKLFAYIGGILKNNASRLIDAKSYISLTMSCRSVCLSVRHMIG
jgi:hypothetical protein